MSLLTSRNTLVTSLPFTPLLFTPSTRSINVPVKSGMVKVFDSSGLRDVSVSIRVTVMLSASAQVTVRELLPPPT